MAYTGKIARVLVSAPGDLGTDDLRTIVATSTAWTRREGETHGVAFVPMHWSADTAAEFGIRPQESINQQLVDRADVVIALFWTRLGTPTGEADSGTVEELTRAAEAGKYVAVLRCRRPVLPSAIDTEQLDALDAFFDQHRGSGLIKDYVDDRSLEGKVTNILMVAAGRVQADGTGAAADAPARRPAEVWATAERTVEQRHDSKGRLKNDTKHFLVVENTGDLPAHDVDVSVSAPVGHEPPEILEPQIIEVLPPRAPMSFRALLEMGTTGSVRCTVRWYDDPAAEGVEREVREQVSTVRF